VEKVLKKKYEKIFSVNEYKANKLCFFKRKILDELPDSIFLFAKKISSLHSTLQKKSSHFF